ncbi:hypothetical protein [Halostagnicola larsenii]|nr:hypothetical protein [Halostagnicola larsenii]
MSIWYVETWVEVVPVIEDRSFGIVIAVIEFLGPDDIEAARL